MTFVTKMEDELKNFHGALINKKKQSISESERQNTRARKVKLPEIDVFMAMCFVTTIIFIRMKSLNKLYIKTRARRSYAADVIEAKLYGVSWKLQILY